MENGARWSLESVSLRVEQLRLANDVVCGQSSLPRFVLCPHVQGLLSRKKDGVLFAECVGEGNASHKRPVAEVLFDQVRWMVFAGLGILAGGFGKRALCGRARWDMNQ